MKSLFIVILLCGLQNVLSSPLSVCPNIITREQWNARRPTSIDYTVFPVEYVIIHHTVTPSCTTKSQCSKRIANIQTYNLDGSDLGDIAYNFIVGGDGNVYEGRGWHKYGAHTYGYNSRSIGIGFVGTFTDTLPTADQMQAAKDLMECGIELGELSPNYKLYGARQVSSTASPGSAFFKELKKWPHFATPPEA